MKVSEYISMVNTEKTERWETATTAGIQKGRVDKYNRLFLKKKSYVVVTAFFLVYAQDMGKGHGVKGGPTCKSDKGE